MTPSQEDVVRIAEGLTASLPDMLTSMISERWLRWFSAADFANHHVASFGSRLDRLVQRGLLDRRSDPEVWGRSQYCLNEFGLAVRDYLLSKERGQ